MKFKQLIRLFSPPIAQPVAVQPQSQPPLSLSMRAIDTRLMEAWDLVYKSKAHVGGRVYHGELEEYFYAAMHAIHELRGELCKAALREVCP
jgi:hypothetical protein